MSGRVCCFTSFTYRDLGAALVLAETLREAEPGWELRAVVVDEPPAGFDRRVLAAFDGVDGIDALGVPPNWLFRHRRAEACAAVKGRMLEALLAGGAATVVYLDPATAVFNPLDPVLAAMAGFSIALTPRVTAASTAPAGLAGHELAALRLGSFDLGFLAVRNDRAGRDFAAWWAAQLDRACFDAPDRGLYLDHKYCDLVPGLFPGVRILRDAGCNVGPWNLAARAPHFTPEGMLMAGEVPLRFCRFDTSAVEHDGARLEAFEIAAWHRRRMAALTGERLPAEYWHFDHFADGTPIRPAMRALFRAREDLIQAFDDPFAVGPGSYHAWLGRERADLLAEQPD